MFGQEWFFFWSGEFEFVWTVHLPAETSWTTADDGPALVQEVQE